MRIIAAILSLGLCGCASAPNLEPLEWSSLGTDCYDRGLSEVLLFPDSSGTMLSRTDIRIGRLPDSGNGSGLVAHFRQGLNGPFGQSTRQPQLFLAVGDWRKSCSVLTEHVNCPQAARIYDQLKVKSIPVGHAFDDSVGLTVLHGTEYFLSSRDGHGNQMDWSYVGSDHPLQDFLDAALDSLSQCAAPASAQFEQHGR